MAQERRTPGRTGSGPTPFTAVTGIRDGSRKPVTSRRAVTDLEVLALRMAASGCVSGRLWEWPLLASAFEALGIVAEPNAPLSAMRTLAKAALQALGER